VSDKENIVVNLNQSTLYKNGRPVHLTQLEYDLVIYFLKNKNTLLNREDIVSKIWYEDKDNQVNLRKVDSFVKKVRAKLGDLQSIKSVRGLGYRWEE
jgi:DNA-binding response OmpR family regulator